MPLAPPALRVADLSFAVGDQLILEQVSLEVAPGEAVAILGENGSGKSTLLKTMLGINSPSAGTVELLGERKATRVDWGKIGYVPQRAGEHSSVPTSALETVKTGLVYGRRLFPGPGAKAKALAALEVLDARHLAHREVATLSGGQFQRVAIARALVRSPELLMLDEPLAGLDLAAQAGLAQTIAELKAQGIAVVIVLHETDAVAEVLDRVLTLQHGAVVYSGPLEFAPPIHSAPRRPNGAPKC